MISFFGKKEEVIFVVSHQELIDSDTEKKISWLLGGVSMLPISSIAGPFFGPRSTMVTPWSTNAVEMTQNMGVYGINRIERFFPLSDAHVPDAMLHQLYDNLDKDVFSAFPTREPISFVEDIATYNLTEGLALSDDEIDYLEQLSKKLNRLLTDVEVFGFSQINSEHCRHKIFNGTFVLNGEEKKDTLFALIKKTASNHPNEIVSAYADNVAFLNGPEVYRLSPDKADNASFYQREKVSTVLSLKAETHNFPTTVEPFNGAATGSGGEIRDRMAGGMGSIPLAGTAVYMTAYPRLANRPWEQQIQSRPWLYQTPVNILIKASNGASDFGNKFGQPLIAGSLYTFEHQEHNQIVAFDKVIMLAGGVGSGVRSQAFKKTPSPGDKVVLLGGDNYRIGMGGAAVSSANTGDFKAAIELNAIQRANPEMQKRVANVIRALVESKENPIVAIHDHGAGGHLNCFSELLENVGGYIDLDTLPLGDPTLSAKELVGNESQERMGLIIPADKIDMVQRIAAREKAPMYVVGEVTGDHRFVLHSSAEATNPLDLSMDDLFGNAPKTVMTDNANQLSYASYNLDIKSTDIFQYVDQILQLEGVSCKDWLTNKVDRCVGGLVAKQQCAGPLQLPLNNYGLMALAYDAAFGMATSIGHNPSVSLINPEAGTRLSIAESLTNIIWAPLEKGIKSVSLSANWMWPCNNPGEDKRLYQAVQAASAFCIELGINIPTGKDSLSMKQKYPNGMEVLAPGTVIISAAGLSVNINEAIEPVLQKNGGPIYYINLSGGDFQVGGSAFLQTQSKVGGQCPDVSNPRAFAQVFDQIQHLIKKGLICAGHDVSGGGLITTLLEMCFADNELGMEVDLSALEVSPLWKILFAENPAIVFQTKQRLENTELMAFPLPCYEIGKIGEAGKLQILHQQENIVLDIPKLRNSWFETSWLFDKLQTAEKLADARRQNFSVQPLRFHFPSFFTGKKPVSAEKGKRPIAAVLREKGSNSEREMANALFMAGFEVKDVHMTDLISGRETLEEVHFLGAVGGFSNSDVLGSAKGWAGSFLYNDKARQALDRFFSREDVLSLGVCNGCQLFIELGLLYPDHQPKPTMGLNDSKKHESGFVTVNIIPNNSVMLSGLSDCQLGVWISHGEGKFQLPLPKEKYNIVGKYAYEAYPANPNGSDYAVAMLASQDGRHLAMMPHLERSIFPWNWAHYPKERENDVVSPWIQAFVNAREWLIEKM